MLVRQMLEIYDLLDTPQASGEAVAALLRERGAQDVTVTVVGGNQGTTDCVKVVIPGRHGKSTGGDAPTLGIVGRLGGIGARPEMIGQVSDGDGALAALTVALKLAEMHHNDDILEGDVIIGTHVCPDAPTIPHEPVPFMDSPIDMAAMNEQEVDARMDAVLSIDTTKGNRIINVNGFAISPTVLKGAILPVSNDVLDIMTRTTGRMPQVFALSQQDITPYGNDLYHAQQHSATGHGHSGTGDWRCHHRGTGGCRLCHRGHSWWRCRGSGSILAGGGEILHLWGMRVL